MRLALLICVTMLAFAANSVLTRAAVEGGLMDPQGFALVRVLAGALALVALTAWRAGGVPWPGRRNLPGALSLAVYMIGFSLAYATLDAGLGALILFGVVQITIFLWSAATGVAPTVRQIAGALVAFGGLALVLWPGAGGQADPVGAGLMVAAGAGWAVYTIAGRGAADPLAATALNFLLCLPMVAALVLWQGMSGSGAGVLLAVLSGAVTSGMGYALWYHIVPRIAQTTSAVVQLSVPVLAILGGALWLGETVTGTVLLSAALVLGGIAWALTGRPQRTSTSSGS